MNIFIIEDEPYYLEKLVSVLTSEHYNVETAGDGKTVLTLQGNANEMLP